MGVIRERKFVCEAAVPSNPESVHSGYTTQESEDEEHQGESSLRRRQPLRTPKGLNLNFNINITKHSGRRKTRRVLNNKFLETLREEEEIDNVVMSVIKSKFQILMEETEDALEFLNSQDDFESGFLSTVTGFKYIEPYFSIPRKIRVAINNKRNFRYDLLKSLEDILISFIYSHPPYTNYFHFPRNCYERFLVHAVAKYNGLYSETINLESGRAVKVHRGLNNIMPQAQLLCDFINDMKNCDEEEE